MRISSVIVLGMVLALSAASNTSFAQDDEPVTDDEEIWLLRWSPEPDARYTYMLSTSGTRGESISVRTELFEITIGRPMPPVSLEEGGLVSGPISSFIAIGETVPDGAPLALRFQRSLFPHFKYLVSPEGWTFVQPGQPFPPFMNIPAFPENEVAVGSTWTESDFLPSGNHSSIPILNDPNVGYIPFTFESTLSSIANFRGEECAVIDTIYEVALEEGRQSIMPFLGVVEGDTPEEMIGMGAPVGGVVEDSRAHEAGIEPGDYITEAEGQRIRGWGGLEEIVPYLVPEMTVEFTIKRGDEEFQVEFAPEGVAIANVEATGTLRSVCFFSIERGIPIKIDLTSEDLTFTLTSVDGEAEEVREADLHVVLEYQYEGR